MNSFNEDQASVGDQPQGNDQAQDGEGEEKKEGEGEGAGV